MFLKPLFSLTAILLSAVPVMAEDLLSLRITSPDREIVLDLEDLDALPQVEFETSTPWTDGVVAFSGVLLKTLLDDAGIVGGSVELVALNDYAVTVPADELSEEAPLVATRMDGETMSVRDKGPFWVVYPYDRDTAYQTETVYSRSTWQLNRIRSAE